MIKRLNRLILFLLAGTIIGMSSAFLANIGLPIWCIGWFLAISIITVLLGMPCLMIGDNGER